MFVHALNSKNVAVINLIVLHTNEYTVEPHY